MFQEMEHERSAYQKLMLSFHDLEEDLETAKAGGGTAANASVDPQKEAIMAQQTLDIQQLQEELVNEKKITKKASQ